MFFFLRKTRAGGTPPKQSDGGVSPPSGGDVAESGEGEGSSMAVPSSPLPSALSAGNGNGNSIGEVLFFYGWTLVRVYPACV